MISSPGLGSGLDIPALVSQLLTAEQQPLVKLAKQETVLQGQLTGYGQLKSALATFQSSLTNLDSTADFNVRSAQSSDEDVLTASAGANAAKGVFNIEVVRLAENHRLASNNTFADTDTTLIGTGGDSMTISVGGNTFSIAYGGQTLAAIRDAINSAADNTGVTASILSTDAGHRLIVAADETGSDQFVAVSYNGSDPFALQNLNVDRNGDLSFTAADLDARLTVESQYAITRTSNTISDAIEGVTLTLVDAGTTRVTVSKDDAAVQKNVQALVDSFNKVITTLRTLATSTLSGDRASITRIEAQLRAALNAIGPTGQTFTSVFEVGIKSSYVAGTGAATNGQLELDSADLQSALQQDGDGVAALFAATDTGIVSRLKSLATGYLNATGLISGKEDAVTARIDDIDDRRAAMERRLEAVEQRLYAQFNAMDSLVAQLQSTGNYLTQQLSTLSKISVRRN